MSGLPLLVVNCGSSTLKFKLFTLEGAAPRACLAGTLDRLGGDASLRMGAVDAPAAVAQSLGVVPDHAAGMRAVLAALRAAGWLDVAPRAIGHRVVHGGARFNAATRIDAGVLAALRASATLAPLHNPAGIAGIAACLEAFPGVPQVAVFDTAFHHDLPPAARHYAVPQAWHDQFGVRRYGFHGLSHAYVARRAAAHLGRSFEACRLITLHLGHGASMAAIRDGRCVETSMGMTPLEGLVMGGRGGDLDPGVILHMQRVAGLGVTEIEHALNHASGLKGLCGEADMRAVLARAASGDARAELALAVYIHRIRKYLGGYFAVLGRPHALVFTGGVGENAAAIRARACRDLAHLDIHLDETRNADHVGEEPLEFQADTAPAAIRLLRIRTDEELEIATQTWRAIAPA